MHKETHQLESMRELLPFKFNQLLNRLTLKDIHFFCGRTHNKKIIIMLDVGRFTSHFVIFVVVTYCCEKVYMELDLENLMTCLIFINLSKLWTIKNVAIFIS